MSKNIRVLNLEDNASKHASIERVAKNCRINDVVWAKTFEEGMEQLDDSFGLIITDMQFPPSRGETDDPEAGEKVIREVSARGLDIPVIICSSVKYRIPEAHGCVWYSARSDWERELRELIESVR